MSRRGFGHRLGNWLCKVIWWGCWAAFAAHIIAGH